MDAPTKLRKGLLTHSDAIVKLFREENFQRDREDAHRTADEVLCGIIELYLPEYKGTVEAFRNLPKWYA